MTSPAPYIKNEPDDQTFNFLYGSFNSNNTQQYGGWQSSSLPNGDLGDLNFGNNTGAVRTAFGSQQNLSSSAIAGSSALNDDDLTADFIDYDNGSAKQVGQLSLGGQNNFGNAQTSMDMTSGFFNANQSHSFHAGQQLPQQQQHPHQLQQQQQHQQQQQQQQQQQHQQSQQQRQQSYLQQVYSSTPPGTGPIQSPFVNNFNYAQWNSVQSAQNPMSRPSKRPTPSSLGRNSSTTSRPALQKNRVGSEDPRSPLSPMTPGLSNPHRFDTSDSRNYGSQGIPVSQDNHSHRQSASGQWENGLGSAHSYLESPLLSPLTAPNRPPMSNIIAGTKHASLPTKQEPSVPHSAPTTTAEAKKKRRRESHNAVERRRRDNINDRIQELSRLVPPHRLEDDRTRKNIGSASGFGPSSLGSGMSPPQATSLLAGGGGRRAAGSITQGLPIDDKDKNPAKGDVLNAAVTWTRDLMWILHRKLQQESMLIETIETLGGTVPYGIREDEQRMQAEILAAIERNGAANFEYSRSDGGGLFVPKHPDHTGGRLSSDSNAEFDSNMPQSNYGRQDSLTWDFNPDNESNRDSLDFKEEDEFGMDMS